MTRRLPLIPLLALALAVSAAQARDRCAGGKLSRADAAYCADLRIKELDEAMANALRLALGAVPDPKALKAQQLAWQRKVLDRCRQHDCLLRTYQARTAELARLFASHARITDKPLSSGDAQDTCQALANLADRQRLPGMDQWPFADAPPPSDSAFTSAEKSRLQSRELGWPAEARTIYLLRLAPGAPPTRFASFLTGGSCPAYQTYNLPYLLDAKGTDVGVDAVPDPSDQIRWAYLGGGDYPIVHQGRNYIVTADLANPDRPSMISWIKPDGRTRPLCLLKSRKMGLKVVSARQPRVCEAVANAEVKPLKWQDATEVPPFSRRLQGHRDEFIQRYGDDAEDIGLLRTDLDRDGKAERIARFRHTSSAGCGATDVWWSVLMGDLGGVQRGPLNEQLSALDEGALEIYKVDGRFYLAASRHGKPGLFQINKGKTEQVCEFRQETRTQASTLFPVDP